MQWFVIGTLLLAAACGRGASVDGDEQRIAGQDAKFDVTGIRAENSELNVFYRTRTPMGDCKAHAAEMPKVWDQVVKTRLKDPSLKAVVLWPENASLQSVAMHFTKDASGQWITVAPCSITIPPS